MLDTNIVSALVHDRYGARTILARRNPDRIAISVIVVGEVLFGVEKRQSPRLGEQVSFVLSALNVFEIDEHVATTYAKIRAGLERRGLPVGGNDLWIAAHAMTLDMTLATANVREFSRFEALRVENWLAA